VVIARVLRARWWWRLRLAERAVELPWSWRASVRIDRARVRLEEAGR